MRKLNLFILSVVLFIFMASCSAPSLEQPSQKPAASPETQIPSAAPADASPTPSEIDTGEIKIAIDELPFDQNGVFRTRGSEAQRFEVEYRGVEDGMLVFDLGTPGMTDEYIWISWSELTYHMDKMESSWTGSDGLAYRYYPTRPQDWTDGYKIDRDSLPDSFRGLGLEFTFIKLGDSTYKNAGYSVILGSDHSELWAS